MKYFNTSADHEHQFQIVEYHVYNVVASSFSNPTVDFVAFIYLCAIMKHHHLNLLLNFQTPKGKDRKSVICSLTNSKAGRLKIPKYPPCLLFLSSTLFRFVYHKSTTSKCLKLSSQSYSNRHSFIVVGRLFCQEKRDKLCRGIC